MDMKLLKERLEKQHAEVGEKLTNIYLPHDTTLLLLGRYSGLRAAINEIIKTLQEQPESTITKSNALFDKCVENCDPAVMKKVSDNVDKIPASEWLEEEIDRLWESFSEEMSGPHNLFDMYRRLARHFAEWGADHLKK